MSVSPNDGGCWFCCREDGDGWRFSFEFDAFFHEKCMYEEARKGNEEAWIMMRAIFGIIEEGYLD